MYSKFARKPAIYFMELKAFDESIIMSEHKIQRHNVYITQLNETGRFTVPISCPLTPTEVKVRAITYLAADPAADRLIFSLHVDSLGNGGGSYGTCLGSFTTEVIAHSGIIEPLPTFSNSTITFYALGAGSPTAFCDGGSLGIHLEFRRIA